MSTYPPDGYSVLGSITWGTDIYPDTTTPNIIGEGSIKVVSTAAAPGGLQTHKVPIDELAIYEFSIIAKSSSSSNPAYTMFCGVNWYDSSGTYISTSTTHLNVVGTSWGNYGGILAPPSTARFADMFFSKAATAFTLLVDYMGLRRFWRGFYYYDSASQTITNSTWTIITHDTKVYDNGNDVSAGVFTCASGGYYHFDAGAVMGSVGAGEYLRIAIYVGGTRTIDGDVSRNDAASGSRSQWARVSGDLFLAAGDTVTVRVYDDHTGTALSLGGGQNQVYFMGHEIR